MKKKKEHQIFFNFLYSYVIVLLIPILLFTNIVYFSLKRTLINNMIETSKVSAIGVQNQFDQIIDYTTITSNVIKTNKYFYSSEIKNFGGASIYIDKLMNKLTSLDENFSELLFYNKDNEMIYSSSNYNINFYFNNVFVTNEINIKEKLNQIEHCRWVGMRRVKYHNKDTYVASYLYPFEKVFTKDKNNVKSMLLFNMDLMKIKELLNPIIAIKDSHAIIVYDNEPILADSPQIFNGYKSNSVNTEDLIITIEGKEYYRINTKTVNNISVICLIPKSYIYNITSNILLLYALPLLLSIILGILIIHYSLKHNYRPISSLVKRSAQIDKEIPQSLNELEKAVYVMENLNTYNNSIISDNKLLKLNKFILRLVNSSNEYCNTKSFERYCDDLGIEFASKYYCCTVLSVECMEVNKDRISSMTHKNYDDRYTIITTENIENNSLICIVASDKENFEYIKEFIVEYAATLEEGSMYYAGIGNFVDNINEIELSYRQAYSSMLNADEHLNVAIYNSQTKYYSKNLINKYLKENEQLYQSVVMKDINKSILSINNISNIVNATKESSIINMMIQNLLLNIYKAFDLIDNNIEKLDSLFLKDKSDKMYDSQTAIILLQDIKEIIVSLNKEKANNRSSNRVSSIGRDIEYILLYINNNYHNYNFSIKLLASELGISVSNLSHYFKREKGINISEYINSLRLDEAKRLLLETDLTLTEIAKRINYSHVSSFTKKFKISENMTPREYRNLNKLSRI